MCGTARFAKAGSDANPRKVRDSKRHHEIVLSIALLCAIRSVTFGQEPASPTSGTTPTDANGTAVPEAERVIVTGSNIPTAEEVGHNPVDTYRADDITRLGVRTPTDFIQRIPAVTGFGVTENNTNSTVRTGADGSTRVDLRGIDPKETLVLEDGRRLANVGFAGTSVDFNQFPPGLIDHIDILKDGASPVYGTDAVAGVVNVFLIHRFRGLELYASYGNTNLGFANDMGQEMAYLLAGAGDDKTNIVVYAGVFNEAALNSADLNIAHDSDHTQWGGMDFRSSNIAGRVGIFQFNPKFNPAALGLRTPTPHSAANASNDPQYVPFFILPREQWLFNFGDNTPAIAPTDREYLYGSYDRDICDKYLTVFADFKYFRQFWGGALASTPFAPDIWVDTNHPFGISSSGISVPTQNPFNPFTMADYTSPGGFNPAFPITQASAAPPGTEFTTGVRYRSLEAGLRTEKNQTDNYLFTGGLKGNLGEFANAWDKLKTWEWEMAVRWNEDDRVSAVGGVVNNNALRIALLSTDPAIAFNPFGKNVNSKAVLDRIFITTQEIGSTTLLTEELTLNGDLFNLPGGPISFAIGTVHLTNHTSDNPDSLVASGQTTGATNFGPTNGSRDSWSQYWEVKIPVTGPTWEFPGAHSLEFDYAERFEDYGDFGITERPKFSVRWQPFGGSPVPLTLRAAYIEAFHAPSLSDLFAGTNLGFGNIHDPLLKMDYETEQDLIGNPNLKPEIAYERTFGGVLTPGAWGSCFNGLTIAVDYGRLDIRGFQTFLDPQFIVDHESEFPGLVRRDPNQSNTIIDIRDLEQNVGRFIESYIDYEAVEVFETSRLEHGDWGTFTATFNGTYLADVDVQIFPGTKRFTAVGKFSGGFQGAQAGGNYTHNRWYTSLFYDGASGTWMRGVDTGAVVHYIGQYWDNPEGTINGHDRKVREWTTLDLIANYTFNFPPLIAQNEVAGYAKDGRMTVQTKDGTKKNLLPVSTAEYNPCGWRAWLNNTTITLGMDNVFDEEPPFVAAAFENGFDEATANAKGRFWYVALKKRF